MVGHFVNHYTCCSSSLFKTEEEKENERSKSDWNNQEAQWEKGRWEQCEKHDLTKT